MVIQCPVCSTKFSVDNTELADRRDPQFHCSRCDCLFDLKGKSKSSSVKNKSLAQNIETSANNETRVTKIEDFSAGIQESIFEDDHFVQTTTTISKESNLDDKPTAIFNDIEIASQILKSKSPFMRFDEDYGADYGAELPLIAAEWPDSRADRDLEIDLGEVARRSMPFASSTKKFEIEIEIEIEDEAITLPNKKNLIESELVTSVAPRLAMPVEQSWKCIPEESDLASLTEQIMRSDDVQQIFDELEKSEKPAEVQNVKLNERFQDTIPTFLTKDQGAILTFPNRDKIKSETIEAPKKKFGVKKMELPTGLLGSMKVNSGMFNSSSVRTLSIFLIGPAISTIALYAASVSPVTHLIPISSSSLKAPPSGLELQALKSEVKILADGTQFLEVTGSLFNNTPATYARVELVARSFDHQNQKSSEILVDVNNGLQHLDNAESLKSDMLLRLQKEKGLSRPIKPSEKIEVRLALPIDSEIPAYFDAEIFGVRKS